MELSALSPLYASALDAHAIPVESLAANSHLTEREKIGELSRQFEAILLREILNRAQKTVIHSTFTDDSAINSIYRDMMTTQLADTISQSGSFGLARSLEAELTRQLSPEPKPEEAAIEH